MKFKKEKELASGQRAKAEISPIQEKPKMQIKFEKEISDQRKEERWKEQ